MPSPSKYIENKANVLLDLYLELDYIKKSKAFKEGDTKLADATQKAIDAMIKRFNNSKKSPMRTPQIGL